MLVLSFREDHETEDTKEKDTLERLFIVNELTKLYKSQNSSLPSHFSGFSWTNDPLYVSVWEGGISNCTNSLANTRNALLDEINGLCAPVCCSKQEMQFKGGHTSLTTPCGPCLCCPSVLIAIGWGWRRIYSALSVHLDIQTWSLFHMSVRGQTASSPILHALVCRSDACSWT